LLDGDSTAVEHERFVERLRTDPDARRYYRQRIELHARLHWELRDRPQHRRDVPSENAEAPFLARMPQPVIPAVPPRRRFGSLFWRGGVLAAIVLAAVGGYWWSWVEDVQGTVEVTTVLGQVTVPMAGQTWQPGQTVRVGDDEASAVLASDRVRLHVYADSLVSLKSDALRPGRQTPYQARGLIGVEVFHDATDAALLLTTPHADLRHATAAKFTSWVTPEATWVEMQEGQLEMVQHADGRAIMVDAQRAAKATALPGPVATQALPGTSDRPLASLTIPGQSLAFADGGQRFRTASSSGLHTWQMPLQAKKVPAAGDKQFGPTECRFPCLSADGNTLAWWNGKSSLHVWDIPGDRERRAWAAVGDVRGLVVSADGRFVATQETGKGRGAIVCVRDVTADREAAAMQLGVKYFRGAAFSPTGRWLACSVEAGKLLCWDHAAGRRHSLEVGGKQRIESFAFAPDGARLAAADGNGTVKFWNVDSGERDGIELSVGLPVIDLAFSPGGRYLAVSTQDGTAKLYRLKDGAAVWKLGQGGRRLSPLLFAPDGRQLVTATTHPIWFWQLPDNLVDGVLPPS
jgi:hypothetical protein